MTNLSTAGGPDDWKQSVPFLVARTCGIILVCVPTIAGNAVSIAVTHRVHGLAEITKVLMTSLAVSDLMIGALGLPHAVASALGFWPFGPGFCAAHAILSLFAVTMSIFCITFLNVERYLAVTMPLRFAALLPRRRVVAVIITGSLSCFAATALFVCLHERPRILPDTAAIFCNFDFTDVPLRLAMLGLWVLTPLVAITLIYYRLIGISRHHARRIRAGRPAWGPGLLARGPDRKALRTFLVVTAAFALCWTPYTVTGAYAALAAVPLPELLELAVFWLAAANSFINVIIYCLFNKAFRCTAKKWIDKRVRQCCWSGRTG